MDLVTALEAGGCTVGDALGLVPLLPVVEVAVYKLVLILNFALYLLHGNASFLLRRKMCKHGLASLKLPHDVGNRLNIIASSQRDAQDFPGLRVSIVMVFVSMTGSRVVMILSKMDVFAAVGTYLR